MFGIILPVIGFSILAGVSEGLMDYLQFHYTQVDNFWNPKYSWRNKWKYGHPENGERFWQSSRALVFLTDGWHLMKFIRNLFIMFAIGCILLTLGFTFLKAVLIVALLRLAYGIGFYLGYE